MPLQRALGRTLIELLVAIGLGLLILLGVGSLFLGANQASRSSVNVASAEEAGQIALSTIGHAVRRAGYAEIVGPAAVPSRADLLYSGPLVQGCVGATFRRDINGDPVLDGNGNFTCNATTAGAPDSLAVVFQSDTVVASPQFATLDCLGQAPPLVTIANPDYRGLTTAGTVPLVRNIYTLNGNSLVCDGSGNPGVPQTLIGDVEEFKVYFGFDDDGQTAPLTAGYRPTARTLRDADYIRGLTAVGPNFPPWDFVVSVHVCVLVRSTEAGVSAQAAPEYRRCPQTRNQAAGSDPSPTATSADGRIRRAYSQVFVIRSRSTAVPAS